MTLQLARQLIEAGHADEIALSLSAQNEQIDNFKVLNVAQSWVDTFLTKPSMTNLLLKWPMLRRAFQDDLARYNPKMVLVPMLFGAAPLLLPYATRHGRKLTYVVHDVRSHAGENIGREQNIAQFLIFRCAHRFISVSNAMRNDLVHRFPQFEKQVDVAPLASLYNLASGPRPFPKDRPLRFLVAGRQVSYKGYHRLAEALHVLGDPNVSFTIAGDGPERDRIAQLFGSMGNVTLLKGWSSDEQHRRLFDDHDVQICAYDNGSQSGLICDALSMSMPTIVTPVGALPEQIGFGKAGWVTADMGPSALAATIRMVAHTPEEFERASIGCRIVLNEAHASADWPRRLGLANDRAGGEREGAL